ncbi:Small nuclear ribonucleoprotein G [Psilocybe cubensis]|uniref:Small nuclear ribonucleoprotein G n=1 Tax=Psilocybe cubensis TaxID=181762 RepID=A0ACB8H5L0_PSICU|nr:Small nuclear ribonucleoprotein G [Psilocybe cubensis]KAH9482992.1 Small nuclear ribonucleoprotein G [Psilocybe cubensis]
MSKASQPELKKFMDKKLFIHLQGGRKVSGVLRGYDLFLNLVIDDAMEESSPAQKHPIGTVYSFRDLANALADKSADPSYVWANYSNLLAQLGSYSLPLEVHQKVLRHCTPSIHTIKRAQIRELEKGTHNYSPPDVESRFKILIRNIRGSGLSPTLSDYNFIIQQFAAYGHFEGTRSVYQEILRDGLTPDHRTFGFCLRSLAFRLSLPINEEIRDTIKARIQELFNMYMAEMSKYNVPMTGLNLEVGLRIMKETLNLQGLESILRRGYAIDLSNLDRIPLEYTERKDNPIPFPFSTAALNTTLDILGTLGEVSKMIQAFEVLTQPLQQASQHFFNSFDSDDEGDFGVDVEVSPPFPFPSATPNTTTYSILIRHLCHLGYPSLARHYILDAREKSKQAAIDLQMQVQHHFAKKLPLNTIPAPRIAISRLILLPAMGEANRNKNVGLMKWLTTKVPTIIRKQQNAVDFYQSIFDAIKNPEYHLPAKRLTKKTKFLTSQYPGASPQEKAIAAMGGQPRAPAYSYKELFEADIPDPPPLTPPSESQPFNIGLHILILKRNVAELTELNDTLRYIYGRTIQRVKERLGRRVWAGKDIFLRSEGSRVEVTKEKWKEIVNFQTTEVEEPQGDYTNLLVTE